MNQTRLDAACVALLALSVSGWALAAPPREDPSKQPIALPGPVTSPVSLACRRPFEDKGVFGIRAGSSGEGTHTPFIPGGGFLEIRYFKATLHAPGAYAADLGLMTKGRFAWHTLRAENGTIIFNQAETLYADGQTRVKFVVYRNQGNDVEARGDYIVRGCLVDRIPLRLKPVIEVPHLPPQVPSRPGPVEKQAPMRKSRSER